MVDQEPRVRSQEKRIKDLEDQIRTLTAILNGPPGSKDEKENCDIGKELFHWKNGLRDPKPPHDPKPEYNYAKYLWYILGYMTFICDKTYVSPNKYKWQPPDFNDPQVYEGYPSDEKAAIAHINKLLGLLLDPSNHQTWGNDLALQCWRLHYLVCGHCSC